MFNTFTEVVDLEVDTGPSLVAGLAEGSLPSLVADPVEDTCLVIVGTCLVVAGSHQGTGVACLEEDTFQLLVVEGWGPTHPQLVLVAHANRLSDLSDSYGESCGGCCSESHHLLPFFRCMQWCRKFPRCRSRLGRRR